MFVCVCVSRLLVYLLACPIGALENFLFVLIFSKKRNEISSTLKAGAKIANVCGTSGDNDSLRSTKTYEAYSGAGRGEGELTRKSTGKSASRV